MNDAAAFDVLASNYDQSFSAGLTGSGQRKAVRKWLMQYLSGQAPLDILEINCGTGDDAFWLSALGHTVTATDASCGMLEKAEEKKRAREKENNLPEFIHCPFDGLKERLATGSFDLVFSNFAGMNCLAPHELKKFAIDLADLIKPGGCLAVVIFGKHTWWESFYYLAKLRPAAAFRRWTAGPAKIILAPGCIQTVHYYSAGAFLKIFSSFRLLAKRPVGLFIPPSYLEGAMKRRPALFRFFNRMEQNMAPAALAGLSDHVYLLLKKE